IDSTAQGDTRPNAILNISLLFSMQAKIVFFTLPTINHIEPYIYIELPDVNIQKEPTTIAGSLLYV
ncbi:MAG: hypothetical protein WBG43_07650, partial [Marinifilaceae bacterium]